MSFDEFLDLAASTFFRLIIPGTGEALLGVTAAAANRLFVFDIFSDVSRRITLCPEM